MAHTRFGFANVFIDWDWEHMGPNIPGKGVLLAGAMASMNAGNGPEILMEVTGIHRVEARFKMPYTSVG